jgi:hypothetical protein
MHLVLKNYTGVLTMISINNLKNSRTYLIGAMDRVADGGNGWRNKIIPHLTSMNIRVLNPCNKPIASVVENDNTRETIEHYKETGQYEKIRKEFGNIRNADLRCVDVSDFVIAHIDLKVHACGSYEEIVTANRQKKPTLVWCEQGKHKAPNWLFFMLPHHHIFSNMNDLLSHLKEIDNVESDMELERWFFMSDH